MIRRRRLASLGLVALALPLLPAAGVGAQAGDPAGDPATQGRFSAPFEEQGELCITDADGRELCKPAGATSVQLVNGQVLYWDAVEGTENVNLGIAFEFGHATHNVRSRVLDVSGEVPTFAVPTPEDGGADNPEPELLPGVPNSDPGYNDGDLFCSDQVQLPDGSILAVGGTDYYAEPYFGNVAGHDYGVVELEGLKAARIYDPHSQTWTQSGSMTYGRWYPSLLTQADGDLLVVSGVSKLIKPVYPERPLDSGRNAVQAETYDVETGEWTVAAPTANKSLPLYPRIHLLPNGRVYYDAAGQVFNPAGQAYDEALWNLASVYDPDAQSWRDLGVPGLGTSPMPGFRGSTFSIMLPLEPGDDGAYTTAEFLSAGGVLLPTPGAYLAVDHSRINTVTIDPATGLETLSSRDTGPLNARRWYGTGVQLPTGEVLVFSGADKDEVVAPGTGMTVTTPELFDPETETWTPLTGQGRERTYHNTAVLLADGRVLVGGHAPISTLYGFNVTIPGGFSPNEGRDPSFEIFEPPYLFWDPRPEIARAPGSIDTGPDSTFVIRMSSPQDARNVAEEGTVVLSRNTALTHLVDSDQRTVELPVLRQQGPFLEIQAPPDNAVAPIGPYLLFANKADSHGRGLIPSEGVQVFVDAPVPGSLQAPGGEPGMESPPFEPTPPEEVIVDNVSDALGLDDDG